MHWVKSSICHGPKALNKPKRHACRAETAFCGFQAYAPAAEKLRFFAAISQSIGLKIARTALKSRTWCCGVKTEANAASLGPMYVLPINLTESHASLFLRFWSKIQCEPPVYSTESLKYLFLLFPSPILCVDFIFEVTLVISLLPTEQKTASGGQKSKQVFSTYLKVAGAYAFSESRFGIYAKSCVYSDFFGMNDDFLWNLGPESCFWLKSCFCVSRTAKTVPDRTDPGVGFALVESTPR